MSFLWSPRQLRTSRLRPEMSLPHFVPFPQISRIGAVRGKDAACTSFRHAVPGVADERCRSSSTLAPMNASVSTHVAVVSKRGAGGARTLDELAIFRRVGRPCNRLHRRESRCARQRSRYHSSALGRRAREMGLSIRTLPPPRWDSLSLRRNLRLDLPDRPCWGSRRFARSRTPANRRTIRSYSWSSSLSVDPGLPAA